MLRVNTQSFRRLGLLTGLGKVVQIEQILVTSELSLVVSDDLAEVFSDKVSNSNQSVLYLSIYLSSDLSIHLPHSRLVI